MNEQNVALTEGKHGTIMVHRADCSYVRVVAALGEPVITLLGVKDPLPDEYERHTCLTEQ